MRGQKSEVGGRRSKDRCRKADAGGRRAEMRLFFCLLFFVFCPLFFPVFARKKDGDKDNFVYQAQGRRDPMIPLVTSKGLIRNLRPAERGQEMKLEGIIYDRDKGQSLAIVDGEILKIGETIGGVKILEIYADKVIVLKGDKISEMSLETEEE
ncbi:MAG: hypothetical protein ACE5GG_02615 [Candidatus Omnitrophota bacterium]